MYRRPTSADFSFPPPTVSLAATPVSLVVPGSVQLTAQAADADGLIQKVDFYAGAMLLGTQTQAPYSLAWNVIAAGTHVVTAVATDDKGASMSAVPVSITVAANQPPSVVLTAPADGRQFAAPVSAQDTDGAIAKVDFYNGGSRYWRLILWPACSVASTMRAQSDDWQHSRSASGELLVCIYCLLALR